MGLRVVPRMLITITDLEALAQSSHRLSKRTCLGAEFHFELLEAQEAGAGSGVYLLSSNAQHFEILVCIESWFEILGRYTEAKQCRKEQETCPPETGIPFHWMEDLVMGLYN